MQWVRNGWPWTDGRAGRWTSESAVCVWQWLEDKQRHMGGRNKKLHVLQAGPHLYTPLTQRIYLQLGEYVCVCLQAELTPDARMVIGSLLRLNCRGGHGTFSTNEAAACAAHKVLLQVSRCQKDRK